MVDYPVTFESSSETEKSQDDWSLETNEGLETRMSVPEEFGGEKEKPSPEDLFSASLQSCLLATFKTIAERIHLDYQKIEAEAKVSLDRGEDSRPVMKQAEINLKITEVADTGKAAEVAESAEKNCFIHNSVNTDVETNFEFRE